MNTNLPIVFCHGLLGWGDDELCGHPYYVCAHELKKESGSRLPPFIFPSTGPVSSLHDQACELFFQLKGGLTDYGAEHSKKFGHKRYTRYYGEKDGFDLSRSTRYGGPALCTLWDKQHPLDFVGHSMGVPVIRMLQYLLAEDYFYTSCGYHEHTDYSWVHSVTSIAGAQNGSILTWILGADTETGILKENASTVRFLCKLLEIEGKYQNSSHRNHFIFDLHLDQWDFNDDSEQKHMLTALADANGEFSDGADWAMYDLTPNAMEKNNKFLTEYPDTWYFSYTTKATFSFFGLIELFVPFVCHIVLWLNALAVGGYRIRDKKWKTFVKRWHHNDGMIPSDAQRFPYVGRTDKIQRKRYCMERKGVWIEQKYPLCMDHAEPAMMPHWFRKKSGRKLYRKIIENITNTRL
jgi:triacylglycerol lipase